MTDTEAPPRLSIVIPCYNELANLENGCLNEVVDYLASVDFTWEVIISNDGSTDGSGEFVHEFCADRSGWNAIDVEHGGKPVAVWGGIQK
jgi:CDP-glycerol glycerophosphotransferase